MPEINVRITWDDDDLPINDRVVQNLLGAMFPGAEVEFLIYHDSDENLLSYSRLEVSQLP
jgi:hypothetical protein